MKDNDRPNNLNISNSYPKSSIHIKPVYNTFGARVNSVEFNDSVLNKRIQKESTKLDKQTLDSVEKAIKKLQKSIEESNTLIDECKTLDDLRKIDMQSISAELGEIEQSAPLDTNEIKETFHLVNQSYRDLEIKYFNNEIDLLRREITSVASNSEQNIKDIAGSTLFSIASVFLGISLTSATVTAVQKIDERFVILFFLTCLLISIISIGLAALFMRKYDTKAKMIVAIIISISAVWITAAVFTYSEVDIEKISSAPASSEINKVQSQVDDEGDANVDTQANDGGNSLIEKKQAKKTR